MVRIKVVKLSQLLYIALVAILAVTAIILLARALPARAEAGTPGSAVVQSAAEQGAETSEAEKYLAPETAPDFYAEDVAKPSDENTREAAVLGLVSKAVLGVDITDPRSMIRTAGFPLEEDPEESASSSYDEEEPAIVPASGYEHPETEHEDPTVSAEIITIELEGQMPYVPPARADGLRALIYHTHTQEAYEQVASAMYVEAAKWRTAQYEHSVVGVGADLSQALAERGFAVVHDQTDFEPPKLGYAYERSLKMLEGYAGRGESFDLYIDLHRDAYSKKWLVSSGEKSTVTIDGKECARIMVLIGDSSAGFKVKSDWKENYKLAEALTDRLNAAHPGLARTVMVKTGRYNQHISTNSILIEVGHNLNTLEEARNTMPYLAEALAGVMR